MTRPPLRVQSLTRDQHLAFVAARPSASHTQLPSWGEVKPDWTAESLGWFDEEGRPVGAGLVLYRPLPKLKRYLAYLPEGPLHRLARARPRRAMARSRCSRTSRAGAPSRSRWARPSSPAAGAARRRRPPSPTRPPGDCATRSRPRCDQRALDIAERLRRGGWQQAEPGSEEGFAAGQPRYVCQVPFAGRSLDDIHRGLNQQWRRNIKKAEKAGVKVVRGGYEDLPAFYGLYAETAERDHFIPRPCPTSGACGPRSPPRTPTACGSTSPSTTATPSPPPPCSPSVTMSGTPTAPPPARKREVQPNNAMQWRMMADAHELGAAVYDFRGITDTLEESNHLLGLLRFKVGAGGEAVEYLGEWDFPLNRLLHKALDLYMARR